ncbi:hypothetical protein D3C79_769250 [compost metagenome]
MLAGKLVEQVGRFFTQHVDQHVQTATVGHTQHHFTRAVFARVTHHFFQHRHQRVATFQRETFGPREFGTQVTFQPFGCCQFAQETAFLIGGEAGTPRYRFNALLDPAFLFGVGDVHILGTDRTAVGLLQRRVQIAQLHGFFADGKRTHVEGFLEVGFGQVVVRRIEIGNALLFPQI